MATMPANTTRDIPTIGFIAHLDTSPDMSGKDVRPRVVQYTGGNIVLNEQEDIKLSPMMFPELSDYQGQEIIVTDGTTLLGADDKAGVAAIIAAVDYLKNHPEIEHGKVRIGFTPDEEIGAGADYFDVAKFGCEWAYTIDGGAIGELEYENFNAGEVIEQKKHVVDLAFDAMKKAGVTPLVRPIRGGTDGARLSFMNLPCPNLFAGGLNFHGRYEFLPVESLKKSMETIIKIIELLAQKTQAE